MSEQNESGTEPATAAFSEADGSGATADPNETFATIIAGPLGFGLILFFFCLGIGGCTYLIKKADNERLQIELRSNEHQNTKVSNGGAE